MALFFLVLIFTAPPAALGADAAAGLPLEQYAYPGAEQIGKSEGGDTDWANYLAKDPLPQVVEYYRQKFPKPKISTSDGAHFNDTGPDTGGLTITLVKVPRGTQILLQRKHHTNGSR